jgi:hypothetical protein
MIDRRVKKSAAWLLVVLFIALLAACSQEGEDGADKKLTQRQRDSVLSETGLPGAELVGTALEAADTMNARAKELDDLSK